MRKIAVLIPCYNEAPTIAQVIRAYRKVVPHARIYVYDNNSTDQTAEIAKKAGAIVRSEPQQGKANVIRSMFSSIEADCYIMVDGDDTYGADNIPRMLDLVLNKNYDMVIGDRLSSTYFAENKKISHNFGNILVRKLVNFLFHGQVSDIMTGQRVLSYRFVKSFPILSKGFEVETEMTIHALDRNFPIASVPVIYKNRPAGSHSKLNTYSDGFKVIITIFRLWKDYKPFVFFSCLAGFFFLIAACLFFPVLLNYSKTGLVAKFPSLIVAMSCLVMSVQLVACGLILDIETRKNKQLHELIANLFKKNKSD